MSCPMTILSDSIKMGDCMGVESKCLQACRGREAAHHGYRGFCSNQDHWLSVASPQPTHTSKPPSLHMNSASRVTRQPTINLCTHISLGLNRGGPCGSASLQRAPEGMEFAVALLCGALPAWLHQVADCLEVLVSMPLDGQQDRHQLQGMLKKPMSNGFGGAGCQCNAWCFKHA